MRNQELREVQTPGQGHTARHRSEPQTALLKKSMFQTRSNKPWHFTARILQFYTDTHWLKKRKKEKERKKEKRN